MSGLRLLGLEFSPYQRFLLLVLATATFFEGFDFMIINWVLPYVGRDFSVGTGQLGLGVSAIQVGTVLAFFVVRLGDRYGRKPLLMCAVALYALFTFLTAFSRGLVDFVVWQFLARIFLIAEWAVAMIYAAEEFPAQLRGTAVGIMQIMAGLGAVAAAGLFPIFVKTSFGWRAMYLVGIMPLFLVLAMMRGRLRETSRWERVRGTARPSIFAVFAGPYRVKMLLVAVVWILVYYCYTAAQTFWVYFAVNERGLSEKLVATILGSAFAFGILGPLVAGRLLDRLGRRPTAMLFFVGGGLATACAFTSKTLLPMAIGVFGTTFLTFGSLPICTTYTAELFPTAVRASALAWGNNLIGRLGMIGAPAATGFLAERLGSVGLAVTLGALTPLVAAVLVLAFFPETRAVELEDELRCGAST